MVAGLVAKDPTYVFNLCTKYLARDNVDERSNFGQYAAGDRRGSIAEAWRLPYVDSFWDGVSVDSSYGFDSVTFVWDARQQPVDSVAVVGSFANLYESTQLLPVPFLGAPTGLWAVTVRVPRGGVYVYRFIVDGVPQADPINPQSQVLDNGKTWSRFFTSGCTVRLTFSRRERDILNRLVGQLLPFRLEENSRFIADVYNKLDRASRESQFPLAYLMDEDVGVANYIDKILAREEAHHADDYHTCLPMIDAILRRRRGGLDPLRQPTDLWVDLYGELAADSVDGWDKGRYGSPAYFLTLLRRHAITGAFAHPRRGGNAGAAGWSYLESRYMGPDGATLFDWRRAIEAPLGHNTDYRG